MTCIKIQPPKNASSRHRRGNAAFDRWVQEMTEAMAERTEKERGLTRKQAEPLLSERTRRVLERESRVDLQRRLKSAAAYRADLLRLPTPLRYRVASIIWWDLFSQLRSKDRVTEFDDMLGYKQQDFDVPPEEIAWGLHQCGYSPWKAYTRAFADEDE